MGENSTIEWTHHTFNPWWGCTKVSPGCDHCYAEAWAKRTGFSDIWNAPARRRLSEKYWEQPYRWNQQAERDGLRRRVFCASMADVFDADGLPAEREWLWQIIEETAHLDWLLLTKRIGNAPKMLPERWLERPRPNVWIGATVVNQAEVDRDVPKLLATPAAIRFLSCEPLLEEIGLGEHLFGPEEPCAQCPKDIDCECGWKTRQELGLPSIGWVIVGGESGAGARPFVLGWGKQLVHECRMASVPVFVKQVGARPVNREGERCPRILDRKGKLMEEWPEELRVREFPRSTP